MATILTDDGEFRVDDLAAVAPAEAEHVTGWQLKPEGMCRGDICVPLPAAMIRDTQVDLAAFWRHLGNPVLHDDAQEVWVLGTGAETRNTSLAQLDAPDFALPDLTGTQHRLSDLRGRKVFLTTWASW